MVELVKRALKKTSVGRLVYPACHACYRRWYSIPQRQRLLRWYGYEALERIHRALGDAHISYFVDYGTLLGLLRDQALIPHDLDMDIALCPGAKTLSEVYCALQRHGFIFNRAFEYEGEIVSLNTLYRGLPIDFFKYYASTSPATMFCYSFYWDEKRTYRSAAENSARYANLPAVTGCTMQRIHGIDVCVPNNAEAILVAEYGSQWKIPNAKWREEDAPNLHECSRTGHAVGLARVREVARTASEA